MTTDTTTLIANELSFLNGSQVYDASSPNSPTSALLQENAYQTVELKPMESTKPLDNKLPTVEMPKEVKFDWSSFMKQRGSLAATTDLIGEHQLHLEQRISEVLFKSDTPVMVGGGPEKLPAVVQCVVGRTAFVHFVGDKTMEDTKLEELILAMPPYPTSTFAKDNLFQLRNYTTNQLMTKVGSMINVGHFFELIDQHNPRIVHTVKITSNVNGFVHAVDIRNNTHRLFITSDRCKRIGWSMLPSNDGHFQLKPLLGITHVNTVPFYVFNRTRLREHNMERRQIVEIIDPLTRYRIVPGIITEIFNKYFFRVQLIYGKYEQHSRSVICHRGSPDLLPANFCSRVGLKLTVPEGYDEANFTIYKISGKHVTDSYFDLPKNVERFDSPRHVEVYDNDKGVMIPATILRTHRHLLILRLENRREFTAPRLYSYFDERVCKVGTAERCGIPFCKMPETIDHTSWTLGSKMQLVTQPKLHNPAENRRFIIRAFSDETQFIPQLYVNFNCYKGPFVNDDAIRFIDNSFPSSPMAPLQHYIINQMLEYVVKRDAMKYCLTTPFSLAPKYAVKLSNPKNDKRCRVVNVEVCEKADQFAGWLRQFLLSLDICPNFISPVKRLDSDPCPFDCHQIEKTAPFMRLAVHLHNPIPVNKQEEQKAKRQNTNGQNGQPTAKRTRSDVQLLNENQLESTVDDLNEPLSTRRARRSQVQTKRFRDDSTSGSAAGSRSGSLIRRPSNSSSPPELVDQRRLTPTVDDAEINTYMRNMNERLHRLYQDRKNENERRREMEKQRQLMMKNAVRLGNGPLMLRPTNNVPPSDNSASQSPTVFE
ncbi:putative Scm-like with four mbt domains 2 [Aphelenchoides besseyi]|nr:putative Scm-like with four mbt domains 2 [Aphelenchoides besseyi]KAI6198610.1 putative Scm-like with four mbt domains 2 [Aphelenchoides besseyi]